MQKSYEIFCPLPAPEAMERIQYLLSSEGVEYRAGDLAIASTRTPVVVLTMQRFLYSHNNWVGINPFTCVSAVDVLVRPQKDGCTRVLVSIDRRRAIIIFLVWIVAAGFAGSAAPQPVGALFFLGVSAAAWFGIVSFFAGYLIREEISANLRSTSTKKAASGPANPVGQ